MQVFKILLISFGVSPDTAYANRLSCIARGFMKNGVDIIVLCLSPNIGYLRFLESEGIDFEDLSSGYRNKYIGFIIGCLRMRKHFGSDKIIWHSLTSLSLIAWILFISKGSRIIHERSEEGPTIRS